MEVQAMKCYPEDSPQPAAASAATPLPLCELSEVPAVPVKIQKIDGFIKSSSTATTEENDLKLAITQNFVATNTPFVFNKVFKPEVSLDVCGSIVSNKLATDRKIQTIIKLQTWRLQKRLRTSSMALSKEFDKAYVTQRCAMEFHD